MTLYIAYIHTHFFPLYLLYMYFEWTNERMMNEWMSFCHVICILHERIIVTSFFLRVLLYIYFHTFFYYKTKIVCHIFPIHVLYSIIVVFMHSHPIFFFSYLIFLPTVPTSIELLTFCMMICFNLFVFSNILTQFAKQSMNKIMNY